MQNACNGVADDYARTVQTRLLFDRIAMTDAPGGKIDNNQIQATIKDQYLDKLWKRGRSGEAIQKYGACTRCSSTSTTVFATPCLRRRGPANLTPAMTHRIAQAWAIGLIFMVTDHNVTISSVLTSQSKEVITMDGERLLLEAIACRSHNAVVGLTPPLAGRDSGYGGPKIFATSRGWRTDLGFFGDLSVDPTYDLYTQAGLAIPAAAAGCAPTATTRAFFDHPVTGS